MNISGKALGAGATLTLVALAVAAQPVSAAPPLETERGRTCAGLEATIVGSPGPDELHGTDGRDVVVALGGDDSIDTGSGPDVVCAGGGFDLARTGGGSDVVLGGDGDDTVALGSGRDRTRGQGDIDALFGGRGDDLLRGGRGTSFIVEGLVGGPGDDTLRGGPGLDSAQYFDSPDGVRVDLRAGRARGHGHDSLIGIEGVSGSNHDDEISGDHRGNGLFGQAGDDIIRGGRSGSLADGSADVLSGDDGDDELYGGRGGDLVTYARTPEPVVVDLGAGSAQGQGQDRLGGVEAVQGSRLPDTLAGGPGADFLVGNLGDDKLDGAAGDDTAVFGDVVGPVQVDLRDGTATGEAAGNDSLTGIENLWGTGQDDQLHGDDGPNWIDGGAGDDLLAGYDGVDLLDGGTGTDECRDQPEQLVGCELGSPERRSPRWSPPGWLSWLGTPAGG